MTDADPPRKPRRKRAPGIPNQVPPDIAESFKLADTKWGPAMAALPSDKHRAFVIALYEIPRGMGAQTTAAKMAGFGTDTSTAHSFA
jgi:hypothetical protein